ncbi:aspartyl protease family protein [Vulcanisaeta sp. JCM 14467]|uniref:aspartyl protease family protein n=1 Tax=Vulcanisaeta sp. JCM 14467 TaxID=1295370 RepID=UPI0006CFFAC8|nr:aspartyl protease family protein [Vulcanisaeta sp. JCM 14467]
MSLVYVDAVVKHGDKSMPVKLLVDLGAIYTILKRDVWEYLGLRPIQEVEFVLADGTVIKRWVSEAVIELKGYGERHTPVVLGESEDENLLGTVTLEEFRLVLDPFRRELRPARMLMKALIERRRA